MEIKKEYNSFYEIEEMVWSGAVDTLNSIVEADKEDEFMQLLEGVFMDSETPTETEVNDFIWFETDFIFDHLGLDEDGNIPKEGQDFEDVEDSVAEMKSTDEFEKFCNNRDCEMCILNYCEASSVCKGEFEDYWNQVIGIEEIINAWKDMFEV